MCVFRAPTSRRGCPSQHVIHIFSVAAGAAWFIFPLSRATEPPSSSSSSANRIRMDIDEIHEESSPSRPSDEDAEFAGDGDEAEEGSDGAHSSADDERASRQVDTQTAIAELAEAQQVNDACAIFN